MRAHTGYTRAHAHVKVDGWIYKEHGREEEEDRRRSRKGSKPDSEALPGEGKRYQSPKKGSHQKGGGSWGGHKKGGPAQKKIGTDGEWGELGPAPPEHCHGCHLRGHPWRECHRRPGDAVPAHLKGKQQQGGKQKGKGKARWNKSADAAAGQGEVQSALQRDSQQGE